MEKDYVEILKIKEEEESEIKKNSPASLPLNPTAQGWSGSEIRKKLSHSIIGEKGSVLSLLGDRMEKTAAILNELYAQDSVIEEEVAKKVDLTGDQNIGGIKNFTDFLNYKGSQVLTTETGNIYAQQITELQDVKLNKIWADITEQATTNLTDILVFNRGSNVYKTTVANLLEHVAVVDLFTVVAELPETGVPNKIYLVPSSDPKTQNTLEEFIWVNNDWERIGGISVDLSDYFNKAEINSMLNDKVDKNANIIPGTHPKITYDAKGLVTGGETLVESDIPALSPSKITQNASNRFVTDAEKSTWNNKVDKIAGKGLSTNDYTTADKNLVATITNKANTTDLNNGLSLKVNIAGNVTITGTKDFTGTLLYDGEEVATIQDLSTVFRYKGSVATYADLPTSGQQIGDVYNVNDTGKNYAWSGTLWDDLGGTVDLSNYATKTELTSALSGKVDKVAGKQLSTEDFTSAEKTKLSGIAANAQVNVLEGVQLNGTDVAISSKKSNIVVNKTTVGLGNVANVDTTNPANITQSATYRFVSDTEKSTWNGKQNALGFTPENVTNKVTTITSSSTNTQYPTAKAVYDMIGDIESALDAILGV